MATEQEDVANSTYGPAMSPQIFQQKWLGKIRNIFHAVSEDINSESFIPAATCELLSTQYRHLYHFHRQAEDLALDFAAFPEEPPPPASFNRSGPVIATVNPFTAAARMRLSIDCYLDWFKALKHGKRIGELTWQQLPRSVRDYVNDMLEERTKMEEDGRWGKSEELRAQARGTKRHD
ncbi:hypothetical protein PRZ48_013553 [Zasmidium cellare]|uniref:Uncharacterized protein n=1 Tax=Zasmidium cellare TaxID=395010 RepID=A0ABR0E1L4_ZASCE|nr:hypothetical protein PRZ48_013553 [Zasmidium cellare]